MIVLFSGVCILIRAALISYISSNIIYNLRRDLYRSVLQKDMEFFDSRQTGDILSRLVNDTEIV